MTIREASFIYGTKEFSTSVGDSITTVVLQLYGEYKDIYFIALQTLNNRFDWFQIVPGAIIRYLPKSAFSDIDEVVS